MFGFSTPGFGLPLLGLVSLVPLLILYEEILSIPQKRRNSFFNIIGYITNYNNIIIFTIINKCMYIKIFIIL